MARKKQLPGVDEQALAELAKQFPGSRDQPAAVDQGAGTGEDVAPADADISAESLDPAPEPPIESDPEPPAPAATAGADDPASKTAPDRAPIAALPSGRRRGGGMAALALLISLIALAVAAAALAPPGLRPWLQAKVGENPIVDLLTGTRAEFEERFGETAASLHSIESATALHASRLDAIEAVGGSNEAAARRVIAVEKTTADTTTVVEAFDGTVGALNQRVAEQSEANVALAARVEALEGDVAARVNAMARTLDSLERVAAGPQRLFLFALKIRVATESSAPFAADVAAAQAVAVEDERVADALRTLTAYAAEGAATHAELRDFYNRQVMPRLRAVDRQTSEPLLTQIGTWLGSLYSSVGGSQARVEQDAAIILALAHENLVRGRLAAAIDQLAELDGPHAAVVAPWLAAARARVVVDEATAVLISGAFDRLVAGG